ncbi:MAG: carboxypeptidase regulatory-like domain-containing protein [Saprospiraceae bacterium]|nr:carboxypeptidase regulatory-like domain-containing protein [Saprospiraceae bacterium]
MPELNKILALIARNRIEAALQILDASAVRLPVFQNDVTHLRNRWADLNARRHRGELTFDEANRQHANIVAALQALAEQMEQEASENKKTGFEKYLLTLTYGLGGLILIAALIFVVNRLFRGPFAFNIKLMPDPGIELSPAHPPLENAKLILHLGNKTEPIKVEPISKYSGEADFKGIAPDYRGQLVQVQLEDAAGLNRPVYWKLAKDSVLLDGETQTLLIVLDNSLGVIRGSVKDAHRAQPIPGATVETRGISATSDSLGRFTLRIPLELQQAEYEVTAIKTGYKATIRNVRPASPKPELTILMPLADEK